MDDVSQQIADLNKRMAYQELLHKEIDPKTNSFIHWNMTATATVIVSVLLAGAVAYLICNLKNN